MGKERDTSGKKKEMGERNIGIYMEIYGKRDMDIYIWGERGIDKERGT